ncbi:arylsulfatase I-like isoform X2 [Eucyclogobius newberryi]|uniref:arylsulfatase I-like isoform X2 n=1 Tax=Eucyclogobius newberryi TaxID=166745 RepID=UPI003B5A6DB0
MMQAAVVVSALSLLLCVDGSKTKNSSRSESDRTREEEPRRPHLIFILIDDQGYNDIGYHNPRIQTPTLDRLASEGVRLESYYVQPICTPSRSQLLTGRYQIHTGLQHSIIRPQQPNCLPPQMDTLPQRLQTLGYDTHLVGKWHLGFCRKSCLPTRKGFDTFFGSLTGSVDYYSYGSCDGPGVCGYDLHENEGVAWNHEGRYSTAMFTQRARKILQNHETRGRPLFLMLSLQAVHTPLVSPKSYIYPYRSMTNLSRRRLAAMVSTVDEAVRNVTYALRKHGLYKNSVIIYSTDNGAQPFTGGSNWPLRGRKGTYWEGGIRGVGFVHSPLLKRRRRVSKDLIHITDWFPTLVRLAGGDPDQSPGLDGFDVWQTISEGKASPRTEILHNIDPLHKSYKPSAPRDVPRSGPGSGSKPVKLKRPAFKKTQKKKKILRQKPQQKSAFKVKKKHKNFPKRPLKNQRRETNRARSRVQRKTESKRFSVQRKTESKRSGVQRKTESKRFRVQRKTESKRFSVQRKTESKRSGVQRKTESKRFRVQRKTESKQKFKWKHQNTTLPTSRPGPGSWSGPDPPSPTCRPGPGTWSGPDPPSPTSRPGPGTWSGPDPPSPTSRPGPGSWSGPDPPSPGALWDTSVQAAIRVGDWKLLTGDPGHGDWVPPQILPSLPGRWWNLERSVSFSQAAERGRVWLFDISADPLERHDLSDQRPEIVQVLLQRLVHYNWSAVPVRFPPDDPRANPRRRRGAWEPWIQDQDPENGAEEEEEQKKKKKRKRGKCHLCKLNAFFHKLNSRMMENKI